jgi:hypothetical protein
MNFYIPDSLQSDFSDMLDSFGTTVTINSNLSVTPVETIVQLSNPNFKSNYQNLSDNARILRTKLSDNIVKGDYLTDSDSKTYIVTWSLYKDLNSYKGQCQLCNSQLDFVRWSEAVLDDYGNQATPAQYNPVVSNVLCFTSRTGMGIFDSSASEIGIIPQGRMLIGLQYNSSTKNIQIGDELSYRGSQFEVVDIDMSMLNDSEETGILAVYVQKRAGGVRNASI